MDKDMADPDDAEIARLQARIAEKFQSEYKTGLPLVMAPGNEIVPLNWSPEEMGYVQSEEQIARMILSAFRVPRSILGDTENMTAGSVFAAQTAFCTSCINPLLGYIGQVFTENLAADFDPNLKIWWDDVTPADAQQLNQDLTLDLANGLITLNEARAIRGRPPYKHGGDDPLLPQGLAPVPLNTGDSDPWGMAGYGPGEPGTPAPAATDGQEDASGSRVIEPPQSAFSKSPRLATIKIKMPRLKLGAVKSPSMNGVPHASANGHAR